MVQTKPLTLVYNVHDLKSMKQMATAFNHVVCALWTIRSNQAIPVTTEHPLKIGIDGPSGIGKSTFVDQKIAALQTQMIDEVCTFQGTSTGERLICVWRNTILPQNDWQIISIDAKAIKIPSLPENKRTYPQRTLPGIDLIEHKKNWPATKPWDLTLQFSKITNGRFGPRSKITGTHLGLNLPIPTITDNKDFQIFLSLTKVFKI